MLLVWLEIMALALLKLITRTDTSARRGPTDRLVSAGERYQFRGGLNL